MLNSVLFISYDGLTDPLGQSQIIPYLTKISQHPRKIFIISFEKKNQYNLLKNEIKKILSEYNISWYNLSFTSKFGKIGKIYDLFKMFLASFFIVSKFNIKIIHGRGLIPTFIGYIINNLFFLKKIFIIYDFRGFWADERLDNYIWSKKKFLDTQLYNFFKKIEKKLLFKSDEIIVLTNKVVFELNNICRPHMIPITVIPCCADFDFYNIKNKKMHNDRLRNKYNISEQSIIFSYNGSLTGVYLCEEMMVFFSKILKKFPDSYFLILSQDLSYLNKKLMNSNFQYLSNKILKFSINRNSIPDYLSMSDISINFINNTYARIAMSPTKLAESLSLGIPTIINKGIGDTEDIIKKLNAGQAINIHDKQHVNDTIEKIILIKKLGGKKLSYNAKKQFDISIANKKYNEVYNRIEQNI